MTDTLSSEIATCTTDPVDFGLGAKAVDCHAHVYGGGYPISPDALYTPDTSQAGTATQFGAVLDAHGFTHGLLVGAGVYGNDNSCLLDAIRTSHGRMKGIALVAPGIDDSALAELDEGGIVGLRINVMNHGLEPLLHQEMPRLLERARELGWHVQIQVTGNQLCEAGPLLLRADVPLLIDHLGRPNLNDGIEQCGFQALLDIGRSGPHVVKLSAPFRTSLAGYPYVDVDPFAEALIDAFTADRCVWGSDWPFVRMGERIDYGLGVACIKRWFPDPVTREKILWNNPSRLFGFV